MRVPASLTTSVLRQLLREGVPNDTTLDPQVVDNAMSVVTAVQANHDQLVGRMLEDVQRQAEADKGLLRLICICMSLACLATGAVLGALLAFRMAGA